MNESRTVLVIGDDHDWADLAGLRLLALGCRVRHAPRVQDAVAAARREACDVALVDHASLSVELTELIERLRDVETQLPIIVLADPRQPATELPLGVERCLSRLRPWRDVEHAVEEALVHRDQAPVGGTISE